MRAIGNRTAARAGLLAGVLVAVGACSDGSTGPGGEGEPTIRFATSEVALGTSRTGEVVLRNDGTAAGGPIELRSGQVQDGSGQPTLDARVDLGVEDVATLNAGASRTIGITVVELAMLAPGTYEAAVTAHLDDEVVATTVVSFTVQEPPAPGAAVSISAPGVAIRQGDVAAFTATVVDSAGEEIPEPVLAWRVEPAGAGFAATDGRVVGYQPGEVRVVVAHGAAEDTAVVEVTARGLDGAFTQLGTGPVPERFTSDVWVHGSHAYTGSWMTRIVNGDTATGNTLLAWNIATPTVPQRTDSVRLDARVVNDVKVASDGALAVASHEFSADGRDGVTLLDLADPAHPEVIARFMPDELSPGVHNVWIDGTTLYVVTDGSGPTSGLNVVDISNPADPQLLSHFYAGSSFLHDVLVRDGLAFLSHWNAGLVILDVGNGIAGGSPSAPVEVSRIDLAGQTHNAWYWPEAGYVFVGEEDTFTPGIMHVVDVASLHAPVEVATFRVPGDTPHNFWLDEDAQVLYLAWYSRGLRALDVSGRLLGELEKQGREIAAVEYGAAGDCPGSTSGTCAWAPQLHSGTVWVADMNRGLFSFRLDF